MKGIIRKEMLLYKSILILEKDLNTNMKYTGIPGATCGVWVVEILVFYGTIKSIPKFLSNTSISILFLLTFINTVISSVWGNTMASKVFTESRKLLQLWKGNATNKVQKREIKALYPARLRVFDCFSDQLTPFVAQDFIANQTISLILLWEVEIFIQSIA